jgi:haloacetate dehalogenase
MTSQTIDGFRYDKVATTDGVSINVAYAGQGTPVALLHGFPETHLMWRKVAVELAHDHTVIVPDLRGYGESGKPEESDATTYSKRTMAQDLVDVMRSLGHERFAIVGHDRGALVAVRAGLDHPENVTHLGILDVLPTLDTWNVLHGVDAKIAWQLFLMAQPKGLPEKMIESVAEEFFSSFLDAWDPDGTAFTPEIRQHYIESSSRSVPSIVADYRASAGIDLEMDKQDRANGNLLTMPVAVISQDWGSQLGFNPTEIWGAWSKDMTYEPINSGHFMAESHPQDITEFIRKLTSRTSQTLN